MNCFPFLKSRLLYVPRPQPYITPFEVITALYPSAQAPLITKQSLSELTSLGKSSLKTLVFLTSGYLCPSLPFDPLPHEYNRPSLSQARVCVFPAAIPTIFLL